MVLRAQASHNLAPGLRLARHRELAEALQALSDPEMLRAVARAAADDGLMTLSLNGQPAAVFVKLVPLADRELRLQHERPTANLFGVPPYYHYRLGSYGSGAWREVAAHEQANHWVRSGQCQRFPLLHHLRVLPIAGGQRIAESLDPAWRECREVQHRVMSIEESSNSIALFLEYFPNTLTQTIADSLDAEAPATALATMETQLLDTLAFLHSEGSLHLDAHPDNVVTDGQQLILTDFGLTLSQSFDLDSGERRFLADHADYDRCVAIASIVGTIVRHYAPDGDWRGHMQNMIAQTSAPLRADIIDFVARRAPLAIAMGDVYSQLGHDPATTIPPEHFASLLREAGDKQPPTKRKEQTPKA